ncbi:MAG: hypothetical protein ACPGYY_10650, partial [Bacteroidia bacterium]
MRYINILIAAVLVFCIGTSYGQNAQAGVQYRIEKIGALKYAVLLDLPADLTFTDCKWSNCQIGVLVTDSTSISSTNKQGAWTQGSTFDSATLTGACSQNAPDMYSLTLFQQSPDISLGNCTSGCIDTLFFITASVALDTGEIRLLDGSTSGSTTLDDCLGTSPYFTNNSGDLDPDGPGGATTFTWDVPSAGNTLAVPVELVDLEAVWEGEHGLLTWSTAMELNNDYFEILRSIDGEAYEVVGRVDSKADGGNSLSLLDYEFVDFKIRSRTERIVSYQLIQHDFNGEIQTYNAHLKNQNPVLDDTWKLYPTLAQNTVFVKILGSS